MAQITAQLVKQLREMTDSPMMECKKALVEADGDIEKAVDVLRTRGLAAVEKKAGRDTNEGRVSAFVSEDGRTAALAEANCETDFVSGNPKFGAFAAQVAKAACINTPSDLDTLMDSPVDGETVSSLLSGMIHNMGENMKVSRFAVESIENGAFDSYIHMGGKIGVIVAFKFENAATRSADAFKTFAHDVAMQIAATNPVSCVRDDVPAEIVEHELGIYKAQAAESGKPANIQEKIATGRLEKFFKAEVLTEQDFVKNPDTTIKALAEQVSKELGDTITVDKFKFFRLGE